MELKMLLLSIGAVLSTSAIAQTAQIIRDPIPDFPISTSVIVPAQATTYYFSGVVPSQLADGSYGNTETQTVNVLQTIQANLEAVGLTMADVVKMQVFLVGDPKLDHKMDFAGFMRGYIKFFGTAEQPNTPVRSAMQVAGLVNPEFLVEIEVVAARLP